MRTFKRIAGTRIVRTAGTCEADQGDLRSGGGNLGADNGNHGWDRNDRGGGGQGDRRSGWDWQKSGELDQRVSRNGSQAGQRVNGAKPEITANTVANDAAENNKKMQNTRNVQKAWYHIW